jgi:hypothetical protein
MELTKEQTYSLIYNRNKTESIKNRFKYTTKYKWYCLSCLTPLYIGYTCYGRNAIFCPICYSKFQNTETIIQYQNMRVLKENQLKIVSDYEKRTISRINKYNNQ